MMSGSCPWAAHQLGARPQKYLPGWHPRAETWRSVRRQSHRLYFGIVKPSNRATPVQRLGGILVPAPCLVVLRQGVGKERPVFASMVDAQGGSKSSLSSPPSRVDVLRHGVSPSTRWPCQVAGHAVLEGGGKPILGNREALHSAGAQQVTEGWTSWAWTQ